MNDEEIKKALECCFNGECEFCPNRGDKFFCFDKVKEKALDLINRQQERIEELEIITGLANNRKYYRKFVDEVFCKQKGNELSEPDFDYIYQLYFEQQAEIERLKELVAEWKRVSYTYADSIEKIKSEAIKEFAERFIDEECAYCSSESNEMIFFKERFDNLLAEMVGGENA